MKRSTRLALTVVGGLLVMLCLGPLLVPVRPLPGTYPPGQLADSDSRFINIGSLSVHYKLYGQGEPAIVLLHGFGASTFSWREVLQPLAGYGTVVAFDRPAFGLTERPLPGSWQGEDNPYSSEAQADLTVKLIEALGFDQAILVGNSAGGTVALLTALRHPESVQALVLVDAAVYVGGHTPSFLRPLLALPQVGHLAPLLLRRLTASGDRLISLAWHDVSKVTPETRAGYARPFQVQDWDLALWEMVKASRPLDLASSLDQISVPTLVITGDDDRIVPTEQSIRLASELPNAQLAVLQDCGHLPQEECPDVWLEAVIPFLSSLP